MIRRAFLNRLLATAAVAFAPLLELLRPAKAEGDETLTRIAFGSCADQARPQPIWDAIFRYRPDLFLMIGDNVYGDMASGELTDMKAAYAAADALPQFRRLRAEMRHLVIWDDHDFGRNDGGADYPLKRESKELFLDFWRIPAGDPRRMREGLYHAATFGPAGRRVQVILPDTRWFRSPLKPTDRRAPGKERYVPDDDPAKTMLGEAQWAWLESELLKPADLRLFASSVQVVADGHGWERWGNFPRERQRLYDLIARAKASGVIFLSGDRHVGGIYAETTGTPYRLYDLTSSGLNQFFAGAREAGPNRLGELYDQVNFGTIDINWTGRTVALSVVDVEGRIRRSVTVSLDELRLRG